MVSQINPAEPKQGTPRTQDQRDNWQKAKDEIETLQSQHTADAAALAAHTANLGNPHAVTPAQLNLVIGTHVQAWSPILDDLQAFDGLLRETQTATAGQTVFNLNNAYVPGINALLVYVNGFLQQITADYTETSSVVVTFTSGLQVGDEVTFIVFKKTALSGTIDAANVSYTPAGTGAVTRNLKARLDDVVHVKNFGAVGNGVTDDTSAIQTAINTMQAGDALFFPPTPNGAYYRITDDLNIPGLNGLTFFSLGLRAAQIRQETAGKSVFVTNSTATNAMRFAGLWLDGASRTADYGIKLGHASGGANRSLISHCRISSFAKAGILGTSSIIVSITDSDISSNAEGIMNAVGVSDPNGWNVNGCAFENNTQHGIRISTGFGWDISGNVIESNLLGGIRFDACVGAQICGNYFELNTTPAGVGTYFDLHLGISGAAGGVKIAGNYFSGTGAATEDLIPIRGRLWNGFTIEANTINNGEEFIKFDNAAVIQDTKIGGQYWKESSYSETLSYQNLPASFHQHDLRNSINRFSFVDGVPLQSIARHGQLSLDLDNYSTTVVGTGSVTREELGLLIATGATASSSARAHIRGPALSAGVSREQINYSTEIVMEFQFSMVSATTNGKAWLMLTANDVASDPTDDAIGFRVDNLALKGISHDGSVQTTTDLSTTLTNGVSYNLKVVKTGSTVRFFVNGSQKATHSTNIPTGNNNARVLFAATNNADAAQYRFSIQDVRYRVLQ